MVERDKIGALVEISDAKNIEYHYGNFIYGKIIYPNNSTPNHCVRVKITKFKEGYKCFSNHESLNFPKTHVWYYGQKKDIDYEIW